jgi:serine/threonine-protein kinase
MATMPTLEARALATFDAYAELDPRSRAKALERLRASDPALHARVVRLLEADALREPLLRSPQEILSACRPAAGAAPADAAADRRVGTVLGAWRLDGVLGAGGMGTVYRASRVDGQYSQVVALKCAGTAVDSQVLADAIRNERRTLALLEHPNIATLLDGGIDADGHPWFAMQLVQGEPIDQWCDRRRLGIAERLELFDRLCDGLAYAHAKGALHSDIKPSNILVDAAGRPVLLDFGLSSLAARGSGRRARVAMTPEYTAPEVAAEGHSVASDVYALGVVLYRLLCGAPPRRTAPLAMDARAPRLASALALEAGPGVAQARGLATPAALARVLAGDLDAIALACVDADPAERPPSVERLRQDLRAWAQRRPVSVRAGGAGYRLRLFLRRHRTAAVATVLGVAVLAAGLALALDLRRQAARHAEAARAMRELLEDGFDVFTVSSLSRAPLLSRAMLADAEDRLERSAAARDPEAHAGGLLALARSYTTLGDYAHATDLVRRAQRLGAGGPGQDVAAGIALAHLSNMQSRYAQGRDAALAGLRRVEALPAGEQDANRLALEVELARAQWGMARIAEARATLGRAMARAEALAPSDPEPLAALLIQRGQWHRLFSRYEDAMRDFERARALTLQRAPMVADDARFELAGTLNSLREHGRATRVARALLDSRQRRLGDRHPETGKAWVLLGSAQFWDGQIDAARGSVARGEAILRAALGPDHPEVARAMQVTAGMDSQAGRSDEAVATARRVLAIMRRAHGPAHQRTLDAMASLAATLAVRASEHPDDAAAWNEVASLFAAIVDAGRRQGLPMLTARMHLVKARMRIGQVDANAERELREVIAELAKIEGPLGDSVRSARFTLLEVYLQRGELDEARDMLVAMLGELDRAPESLSALGDRFNCHEALGDIALQRGHPADARGHWRQALAIGRRIAPEQVSTKRVEGKLAALAAGGGTSKG